jgi:hypothetical protein
LTSEIVELVTDVTWCHSPVPVINLVCKSLSTGP